MGLTCRNCKQQFEWTRVQAEESRPKLCGACTDNYMRVDINLHLIKQRLLSMRDLALAADVSRKIWDIVEADTKGIELMKPHEHW